jgi:hypothetical protein
VLFPGDGTLLIVVGGVVGAAATGPLLTVSTGLPSGKLPGARGVAVAVGKAIATPATVGVGAFGGAGTTASSSVGTLPTNTRVGVAVNAASMVARFSANAAGTPGWIGGRCGRFCHGA